MGGAALSNSGTIMSLTNSGAISGGDGGSPGGFGGPGGAGVANSGTITMLGNSGTIRGGLGSDSTLGTGGEQRAAARAF